jgi:hypothetical protein
MKDLLYKHFILEGNLSMYRLNGVRYLKNGFLIIREERSRWSKNVNYQGIEGDVWPLHLDIPNVEKSELQYLDDYVDQNITTFSDYSVTDVCNDVDFINKYIKACLKAGINISILLCETEKNKPLMRVSEEEINKDFMFIGFDYGYCNSDYYSCVNSDIGRIPEMDSLKTNKYGLFDTEDEVIEFINLRTQLKDANLGKAFELGPDECYTIYKLWKYKGEYPIVLKG